MKSWKVYALAIVFCCVGVNLVHGEEVGELDSTFGEGGKVITTFDAFGDQAYAVAIQPDGKILAAGSTSNGYDYDIAIVRYTADGQLDTTFADNGKLRTSLGTGDEELTTIAVQSDGNIVAGGYTVIDGNRDFVLVRFTSSGDFDTSFGDGGIVATGFGNLDDEITALTIDDDEKIVVCGYVTGTAGIVVAVARYEEDGEPDTSFGYEGAVLTDIGDDALARSIDVDDKGRIIVTGSYFHADRTELMLVRYSASGDLDSGFGEAGIAVPSNLLEDSEGFGVGITQDDMILVAGTIGKPGDLDSAVYRFTESGQPDLTFGDNGVLVTSSSDEDDMALSIDVLGNVVGLSGFSTFNTKRDFLFVSVEETKDTGASVALNNKTGGFANSQRQHGSVFGQQDDQGESTEGESTTDSVFSTTYFGYTDDVSYAVALQADGKAISVGYTEENGVTSFAIARYVTPVANNVAATQELATVGWVMTKDATNVTSTGAFTGGTILDVGITVTKRGVVYSIAPDPVYISSSNEDVTTQTTSQTNSFTSSRISSENSSDSTGTGSVGTGASYAKRVFAPATTSAVTAQEPQVAVAQPEESEEVELLVSNGSPYGEIASGSTMTYIGVYTNEKAVCKYSVEPEQNYDAMPEKMASADNLSHIVKVDGLVDDNTYTYYVRCRDFAGKESDEDYEISFTVAAAESSEMQTFRRFTSTLGDFFVRTAHAEDDTGTAPGSAFDVSTSDSTGGQTDNGSGFGSYSSILSGLKAGTFYYVRAYAIDSNGRVYYGNQVGFTTSDSCFVATAAYGTLLHPYVKVLRSFRDQYLINNVLGQTLVNLYYTYSPPVADYIAARPVVRGVVRVALLPVIGTSWLVLNIGLVGMVLLVVCIILPFTLIFRSYRRLEVY